MLRFLAAATCFSATPHRATTPKPLIAVSPELVEDDCSKSCIRFALKSWESEKLKSGQGWTKSRRILLFEFRNDEDSLKLKLHIGPGPEEIRETIFQFAAKTQPLFKPQSKTLNKQWNEIYCMNFLSARFLEEASEEDIESKIREHWEKFLQSDLKTISEYIGGIKGLFE